MTLILFRHGHSLSVFEAGVSSDRERPLSDKGRKDVGKSLSELIRRGLKPDIILTSPLSRALETAGVISENLNFTGQPVILEELSGAAPLDMMWNAVRSGINNSKTAIVISHQPLLGILAGCLSGTSPIELKAGGFAALDLDAGKLALGGLQEGCASIIKKYNP